MIKRKCEEFVESNIKGYDVAKHFYKEHLVAMTIRGNLRVKMCIFMTNIIWMPKMTMKELFWG